VVVAFHKPALLKGLLEKLVDPGVEVIVVNVEDDPAVTSLSGARILSVSANIGYAAGVNLGAAHASADSVVFMNDDVSLDASGVLMMVARLRSGHADAVVPLVEDQDGELELAKKIPYGLAKRMQLQGEPIPREPTPIDSAWAPIVAVLPAFLRAGMSPEDYFIYGEKT
jgi:GT2 family glycosyltransferase